MSLNSVKQDENLFYQTSKGFLLLFFLIAVFSHRKPKKPDFQVSAALVTSSMRGQKEACLSDQN